MLRCCSCMFGIQLHACISHVAWWRHQMETFSASLALCAGNSPVTSEFPAQRPVTRSFDVFSYICTWINRWVNNGETGNLRRYRAHYDVKVMEFNESKSCRYVMTCTIYGMLIHWGRAKNMYISRLMKHWFRLCLVDPSAPSHYLNQIFFLGILSI